jgi:hypothetical protein
MAKKPEAEPVRFVASFPDVLAQLKIGRDGLRLVLDVPESDIAQALKLVLYRDCVLRVTIEPTKE